MLHSDSKNDGIGSYVIADFARVGRIAIKPWHGFQYLALQRLTRHRMHITECIAREKTYISNLVNTHYFVMDNIHSLTNMVPQRKPSLLSTQQMKIHKLTGKRPCRFY